MDESTIPEGFIACKTKYGSKVHLAYPGSSLTKCGHWLKFNAEKMRVTGEIKHNYKCRKCFQ